jgi:hypothetical protein
MIVVIRRVAPNSAANDGYPSFLFCFFMIAIGMTSKAMTNPTMIENSNIFPIVFPFQGCVSVYSVYTDEGAGRFQLILRMSWDRVLTECSIGTAVWFLLKNVERSIKFKFPQPSSERILLNPIQNHKKSSKSKISCFPRHPKPLQPRSDPRQQAYLHH